MNRHAKAWKVAALGLVAVSTLAVTACDRFSAFDRLGVSTSADGSVQIVYLACDYEELATVSLYDGHDPTVVELRGSAGAAISFGLGDLKSGMVFSGDNPSSNIDAEIFAQHARESC